VQSHTNLHTCITCREYFRNIQLEQIVTAMYLYDVPNMEFLLSAVDHPHHCNASLPTLQFNAVNLTSPSTGETLDLDPNQIACDDNGRLAAGCVGYSKGFALPTYEVWELASTPAGMLGYAACVYKRAMLDAAATRPPKEVLGAVTGEGEGKSTVHGRAVARCGGIPVRNVAFWRGTCTGMMRGWSKDVANQHHDKITGAGGKYWYLSKVRWMAVGSSK
jgi:hypothetical protein